MSLIDIEFEIKLLNPKKAATHNSIPPKIIKSISEAAVNVFYTGFLIKQWLKVHSRIT